ncbi:MAG: hypothetical protein ACYSW3_28745, partial [Planctomycetota bacterium]
LYVVHWIVCNNITNTETIPGKPNIYGLFYPIHNADRQLADTIGVTLSKFRPEWMINPKRSYCDTL